ncbi:unnamed protein product [Alopecurus aequalis]
MLPNKMEQSSISSASCNPERTPEKEQVLSDLQALKGLYGLLHKGQQQANENLDGGSRSLLMRMLDDATQQALLKQAKLLSGPLMSPALERKLSIQPRRRTGSGDAEQRLKPLASPSLSLHASEWSRRLKPPQSPARSRDEWRAYGDHRRRARVDNPPLARVVSNRSSRTAAPRLGSYRSSYRAAEPRHDVGSGSDSRAGRGDRHSRLRRGSGRGDRSSSSSSSPESSYRRSESRAPSTERRVGASGSSTSRRVGRLDSRLSMGGVTSRCGSGRAARRGEATPRRSSSSSDGEAATIRSGIRPNRELMERCVRRAEEIREQSLRQRGNKDGGTVRSGVSMGLSRSSRRPRRALDRIDSGSTYSSGRSSSSSASIPPSPSTTPTAPSTSLGGSASPRSSSSSVSVSPRGGARPEYPFEEASSASRSRRRRERQERREGRLRRFKNKLALVFHHRHDHHHHHHVGRGASPLSRRDRGGKTGKSLLGGMFHHRTAGAGQEGGKKKKKSTSRTVVTAKKRGGGGGKTHSLLDALVKHKWGAPKAARAPVVRTRSLSRVQVKKMHWWQQLKQRRGRSSKPRRRLKQGKEL